MNIKRVLIELDAYYKGTRGKGHTEMMVNGACNTDGIIVLATMNHQKNFKKPVKSKFISLEHFESGSIKSIRKPIAFDNATLMNIVSESLYEIQRLEDKACGFSEVSDRIRELEDKIKCYSLVENKINYLENKIKEFEKGK